MLKSGDMLKAQLHNGILNPHVNVCCMFKTGFIALPYYHNYFEIVYISAFMAVNFVLFTSRSRYTLYEFNVEVHILTASYNYG